MQRHSQVLGPTGPPRDANFIEMRDQRLQLGLAGSMELFSKAQHSQSLAITHVATASGITASPTPLEKVSLVPGATLCSSLIAAKLSPWIDTVNAVIPPAAARSASAATRRVPKPCCCRASAMTMAMSASLDPFRREH